MARVRDVLRGKGPDVWSIGPEVSVFDGIRLMAEKEIGALMVVEDQKLVGVMSETDYTRKVAIQGRSAEDTAIREIMRAPVVVRPDQDIDECMAAMTDKRTRHLPVMDGDELIGVVSIGDLVKSIIDDQRFAIEQLERYITG